MRSAGAVGAAGRTGWNMAEADSDKVPSGIDVSPKGPPEEGRSLTNVLPQS